MVKEASETSSFNLPPSREVVFPGGLETLAEQQLGAGKLVVNERTIEANQQAREAEELHRQEIARKVDELEAGTEVKPPYTDFTPSPTNIPSYIPAKTIEALAFTIAGSQGQEALPPVQTEALEPPQQKQEINLQQAFPAGSREERYWREVTGDIRGSQESSQAERSEYQWFLDKWRINLPPAETLTDREGNLNSNFTHAELLALDEHLQRLNHHKILSTASLREFVIFRGSSSLGGAGGLSRRGVVSFFVPAGFDLITPSPDPLYRTRKEELQGVLSHEMMEMFIQNYGFRMVQSWMAETGWGIASPGVWKNDRPGEVSTQYALEKGPVEDICDSFKIYMVDPSRLSLTRRRLIERFWQNGIPW